MRSAAARLVARSDDALPWHDEAVDRLDAASRSLVGEYWRLRAEAEVRVSAAFSDLLGKLRSVGAEPEVLTLLASSVDNELYHAAMCRRLAARYLGQATPPPATEELHLPLLAELDAGMRAAVYAAGMCAINESVATVWLEHCLARSEAPLARAVSQVHLSDEVVHARVGWGHLASLYVTPDMRRRLARYLLPLLRSTVHQWLASTARHGRGVPSHGVPDEADQRAVVLGAIRNVVLPGFHHVGVDISDAATWFRGEFS